jgi:hypothetical protein
VVSSAVFISFKIQKPIFKKNDSVMLHADSDASITDLGKNYRASDPLFLEI